MQYQILFKGEASFVPALLISLVEIFSVCILTTTYLTIAFSKWYFEIHKCCHGLISTTNCLGKKEKRRGGEQRGRERREEAKEGRKEGEEKGEKKRKTTTYTEPFFIALMWIISLLVQLGVAD